jgi:hypothetical protein
VVTDQIDRPCAKQDERRRNGDDGGTDHCGAGRRARLADDPSGMATVAVVHRLGHLFRL